MIDDWVIENPSTLSELARRCAVPCGLCLRTFQKAGELVDETKCIARKVIRIKVGENGVHFVDFCEDQATCPFTVVIFSHGLKDVATCTG